MLPEPTLGAYALFETIADEVAGAEELIGALPPHRVTLLVELPYPGRLPVADAPEGKRLAPVDAMTIEDPAG